MVCPPETVPPKHRMPGVILFGTRPHHHRDLIFCLDYSPLLTYSGNASSSSGPNLNPAWAQSCPFEPPGPLNNSLCDVSSVHSTTTVGASVSLAFYGQSIQLFGNVTAGMVYDVNIDGSISAGTPSGQTLASISNLTLGNHNVALTVQSSANGSTLLFESATVTVGTGLTGANVTRTLIQDSSPSLSYTPPTSWANESFDSWNIPHTLPNSTWHQISSGQSGSVAVPFSGNAIMAYGLGWSFFPTNYRASIDALSDALFTSSSTLPSTVTGRIYTQGLLFVQANLSDTSHVLTLDNANGGGYFGLDHLEVISVTGGSPLAGPSPTSVASPSSSGMPAQGIPAKHHSVSLGAILGAALGAGVILLLVLAFLFYRWTYGKKRQNKLKPRPFVLAPSTPHLMSESETPSGVVGSPSATSDEMAIVHSPIPVSRKGQGYGYDHGQFMSPASTMQFYEPPMTATAAGSGGGTKSSASEMQAIRRDLQQLMDIVGSTSRRDSSLPPEYTPAS